MAILGVPTTREPTITSLLEKLSHRPYLTPDIEGFGGTMKSRPEDFKVVEVPLYGRSGEGQHLYVEVEKRGLTSPQLIELLANHFGFDKRDVGMAGMKDKQAVTRQWLSLPAHLMDDLEVVGPVTDDVFIHQAELHGNKLRTGHLEGNNFELVIRDLSVPGDEALKRANAMLDVLRATGAPNYYGMQRFGHGGSTVEIGLGLLHDDPDAIRRVKRKRRLKKLACNAVQSAVFNGVLARRIEGGTVAQPMLGDRIEWHEERRYLRLDDDEQLAEGVAAVGSGRAAISGPMPGPRHPEADGKPREIELEAYEEWGVTDELFGRAGKLAQGTRRPFTVPVGDATADLRPDGALSIAFFLPSGSYATVVLRELMKDQSAIAD